MTSHLNEHGKRRKKSRLLAIVSIVAVIALLAAAAIVVFTNEKVGLALGLRTNDYEGPGTGEVTVRVQDGDWGTDVAHTLVERDVIKAAEPFIELLDADPTIVFDVGTYRLKSQMSAKHALEALQDPENKISIHVVIPEGFTAHGLFTRTAEASGLAVEDFEKAAADPQALGVPEEFETVEGFLFPATYTFDGSASAAEMLTVMVDRMHQALAEHDVAPEDAHRVLTFASLVQRESGQNLDDFGKIARVFQNRLDRDMLLQSDATVAYGTRNFDTVWTTDEERADPANLYNSYVHKGLPPGPIGLPGDLAIASALDPTPGPWLYFVTVNLETGETKFAEDVAGHERNVAELHQWCQTHSGEGGEKCD